MSGAPVWIERLAAREDRGLIPLAGRECTVVEDSASEEECGAPATHVCLGLTGSMFDEIASVYELTGFMCKGHVGELIAAGAAEVVDDV